MGWRRFDVLMLAACSMPAQQGTQLFVWELAEALGAAGHAVRLVTYGAPGVGYFDIRPRHFAWRPAARIDVGTRSGPQRGKLHADWHLWRTARTLLRQRRCDVVHAHHVEALAVGLALRPLMRAPVVYQAHTQLRFELPTYVPYRWAGLAACLGAGVERRLTACADAAIGFRGDDVAALAHGRPQAVVAAGKPPVLRAEPAEVAHWRRRLGPGPWILYAGNPDAYQNLPLLFAAFAQLRRSLPQAGLLIASPHPPATFAVPFDLPGVVVCQHGAWPELRALHAIAQVGVCPRTLPAGSPIKVLHYLACGLPVVACASGLDPTLRRAVGVRAVAPQPQAFAAALLSALSAAPSPPPPPPPTEVRRYERLYSAVCAVL